MTITDLILNFRAGLLALLPSVERVGIPWRRPDAYDEWDNLATAVYQALVVGPLRCSFSETEQQCSVLPDFDMLLPSYTGKCVIEVLPATSDGTMRVFHAFGTETLPFDMVEWRPVGPSGVPQSDILQTSPVEGARFALRMYANGFSTARMEETAIEWPPGRD